MSSEERAELKLIEDSCELEDNKWIMKYPWKRDPSSLPDNYAQVLKKLQSTEQRLVKRPEYAHSYDMQVKEMEDMKFSRKLTEKEKSELKEPVHYVAHHAVVRPEKKSTPIRIVFNSSASLKGHPLNEYWFKGPDLLNNLFGVVLRFRENAVAVCGNIMKMYHMVAIPQWISTFTDFYGEVTKLNVNQTFTSKRFSLLEIAQSQRWPLQQRARQPN